MTTETTYSPGYWFEQDPMGCWVLFDPHCDCTAYFRREEDMMGLAESMGWSPLCGHDVYGNAICNEPGCTLDHMEEARVWLHDHERENFESGAEGYFSPDRDPDTMCPRCKGEVDELANLSPLQIRARALAEAVTEAANRPTPEWIVMGELQIVS